MMYIPDNYDLFLQHDAEKALLLEKCPICEECGEHIQDDYYYIFDNIKICPDCLKYNHKKFNDQEE